MYVRMRDLSIQDREVQRELHDKLQAVLESGELILGSSVSELELQVSNLVASPHSISCSSASSGLYLALKSLGIGNGDEVVTTPMTWLVTGSAILQVGATPVFVDVDENYNMNPEEFSRAINKKTKAVLVVHYYGRLADIEQICAVASQHGIMVIEDSAQAFGLRRNGSYSGTFGDVGVYSFSPMKVIGGLGDNGLVVCKSQSIAERLKTLRHAGTVDKEWCISPEGKHLMDSLHASFLTSFINRMDETIQKRRNAALKYHSVLETLVTVPDLGENFEHSAYDYAIRLQNRDSLHNYLTLNGIESRIRHPYLVSEQPVHRKSISHSLTRAKKYVKEIICLPIHNNIREEEIEYVSLKIREWFNKTNNH